MHWDALRLATGKYCCLQQYHNTRLLRIHACVRSSVPGTCVPCL
jgi:hypothetical protein